MAIVERNGADGSDRVIATVRSSGVSIEVMIW